MTGSQVPELLPVAIFDALAPVLRPVLSTRSAFDRRSALRVLCAFEPRSFDPLPSAEEGTGHEGPCGVLTLLRNIEEAANSLETERQRVMALQTVQTMIACRRMPEVRALLAVVFAEHALFDRPRALRAGVRTARHRFPFWHHARPLCHAVACRDLLLGYGWRRVP